MNHRSTGTRTPSSWRRKIPVILCILITIGAKRSAIYRLFLSKAIVLGVVGGVGGFIVGTGAAMMLGPQLAGLQVSPMPLLLLLAIVVAVLIALAGSILPVYQAARFDPAVIMQEV